MTHRHFQALALALALAAGLAAAPSVRAQKVVRYNVSDLLPKSDIVISPPSGTFQEGSTFEVPIFVNTHGNNINAVELRIKFDPNVLSVIHPSGGKSIIGLWVEPPSYDNVKGTVKIVGAIPGGITSDSGLIVTVTFKGKAAGQGIVSIQDSSQVLLNDGQGTPTALQSNRGVYTVVPQPPGGVTVYSDSHPFQDRWYNNNSPTLGWNKDAGVSGFSFILDNQPNTVPPNEAISASTSMAYQDLADGLWYFHVKARKQGVWGAPSDYLLRIDTTPPAEFAPTIDYVSAAVISRFLVSFFTTDSLSGIDHYEVGAIDKTAAASQSPVFVETDSPYQLPAESAGNARVIVRAFDRAGNARDESIDVSVPFAPFKFINDHLVAILLAIILLIVVLFLVHYFFGHHIIRRIERIRELLKRDPEL